VGAAERRFLFDSPPALGYTLSEKMSAPAGKGPSHFEEDEIATSLVGYEITVPVHQDLMLQARVSFWLAVGLVVVGVGLLVWAVLTGADVKSIKSVAGIVINVLGGFSLRLYTRIGDRLSLACRHEEMKSAIARIGDPAKRDDALVKYADSLQEKRGWFRRLSGL
jgi:hypothetical protein